MALKKVEVHNRDYRFVCVHTLSVFNDKQRKIALGSNVVFGISEH